MATREEDEAATAASDRIELEAMRKDYSWLPCRVSLGHDHNGGGILVEFESNVPERMLLREKEVFLQLRVHSVPLKDYDCSHVRHGERVLATLASSIETLFFDAIVQEVIRGRHSRSTKCKCNVKIKWLQLDQIKEIFTFPATSVRRLSAKSIHAHPTIRAYLESGKIILSKFAPFVPNLSDELDCELDLSKLVERHFGGIGTLSSNPEYMVTFGDGTKNTVLSRSAARKAVFSNYNVYRGPNNLRRSTRNLSQLNVNLIDHDPSPFQGTEDSENIHCLSPLASCAALALHLSKTPVKLEVSGQSEEKGWDFI